ncbi:hypothetical protein HPB47_008536 [Ixodes persulcatus]|uniref:Uncharacterized protein n=1 Tax=Ixodes persulcatus TaxID=34615 RepID=A0AC60P4Q6_IXOPE|nr:hypothetical protein HPB47_008536 [Ixodes persulcatus]
MSKSAYHDVIPPSSSAKQGELHAICLALSSAQEAMSSSTSALPANLRIFSDSQEAIKECKARASPSKLRKMKNLASQLRGQGVHVKIEWVPGHAGIPGNEEAHRIARAALFLSGEETSPSHQSEHGYAAQRDRAPCLRTYNRQSTALNDHAELDPDEHRTLIRNECRIRLEELLPEDPDPLPSGLGRRAGVLLLRIRTDTTVDPARIAIWSQNKSSGLCQRCKLGARATFAHLAWSCPDLAAIRSRHRPLDIIQLEGWTHPPGTEGARKRVLRTLLDFVFEAGLQAHTLLPSRPSSQASGHRCILSFLFLFFGQIIRHKLALAHLLVQSAGGLAHTELVCASPSARSTWSESSRCRTQGSWVQSPPLPVSIWMGIVPACGRVSLLRGAR